MHYRKFITLLPVVTLAINLYQASYASAADRGELIRLRWEGFEQCKALEGTSSWHAVATGLLDDGGGGLGGSSQHFRLRYCFEQQNDCQDFVSSIRHHVEGIDELWQARCYARS